MCSSQLLQKEILLTVSNIIPNESNNNQMIYQLTQASLKCLHEFQMMLTSEILMGLIIRTNSKFIKAIRNESFVSISQRAFMKSDFLRFLLPSVKFIFFLCIAIIKLT